MAVEVWVGVRRTSRVAVLRARGLTVGEPDVLVGDRSRRDVSDETELGDAETGDADVTTSDVASAVAVS
jgi:hypothetical protein